VTPRTRAVIAVHYGGHPCDLDALRAICVEHRLLLIEDAAHAVPAKYKGRFIGAGENPVAFSFYATKNLTTAEGGMLTGSQEMVNRGIVVSLHGMDRDAWKRNDRSGSWRYDIVTPGFKYNMTDIQAAIGLQQLGRLEAMHARRREIVQQYNAAFAGMGVFELPTERSDVQHAWHLYPLRLLPDRVAISRDRFIEELRARNIGTSVHFIPIHTFTYYRERYGYRPGDFPVALDCTEREISLPLHPGLTETDVGDVTEAVIEIASAHSRQ
jgi:dTDP-4-amino-4,6-dideoxygalactose transaminase